MEVVNFLKIILDPECFILKSSDKTRTTNSVPDTTQITIIQKIGANVSASVKLSPVFLIQGEWYYEIIYISHSRQYSIGIVHKTVPVYII